MRITCEEEVPAYHKHDEGEEVNLCLAKRTPVPPHDGAVPPVWPTVTNFTNKYKNLQH